MTQDDLSADAAITTSAGERRGDKAWKEHTKAIERVISVTLTLNEPTTAKSIAEEASVSEQTTREHLSLLQDLSIVSSTTASGVTKYRPDARYLRFRAVSRMMEKYSEDELLEHSQGYKERIERASEQYDAEHPEELRERAASDETSAALTAKFREAASEWETVEHELSIIEQAHQQYTQSASAGTVSSL
jgi:predicted ArsR family transcriptional regulator